MKVLVKMVEMLVSKVSNDMVKERKCSLFFFEPEIPQELEAMLSNKTE